jgi:hypothetical protein
MFAAVAANVIASFGTNSVFCTVLRCCVHKDRDLGWSLTQRINAKSDAPRVLRMMASTSASPSAIGKRPFVGLNRPARQRKAVGRLVSRPNSRPTFIAAALTLALSVFGLVHGRRTVTSEGAFGGYDDPAPGLVRVAKIDG